MAAPTATTNSPQFYAKRLDGHDEERHQLRLKLIESLTPLLREHMAEHGSVAYWDTTAIAQALGQQFGTKQINGNLVCEAAESLVRAGEWLQGRDGNGGSVWTIPGGGVTD